MHLFSRAMTESESLNLQSITDLVLWCPSSWIINIIGWGWKGAPEFVLWCLWRVLCAVPGLLSDLAVTWWIPHLSGQPLPVLNPPHCKKAFPDVKKTPLLHFVPSGSGLSTRQQRKPSSVSCVPSLWVFVHWWDVPEPSLLSWRTTVLPAIPYRQDSAFPWTPSWPLAAHSPVCPHLSHGELRNPQLHTVSKGWSHQPLTPRKKLLQGQEQLCTGSVFSQLFLKHASREGFLIPKITIVWLSFKHLWPHSWPRF